MRTIGIKHRVKASAEGNPLPTILSIAQNSDLSCSTLKLETEQDELDFVLGKYPEKMRDIKPNEDIKGISVRHLKHRPLKKDDDLSQGLVTIKVDKKPRVVTKVPESYTGLQKGDVVLMILGGSGDNLAYAMSKRAEQIGAKVLRVSPAFLKQFRDKHELDAADDATNIISMYQEESEYFYKTMTRDRDIILVRERYRARIDAMKARIACEQRLRQQAIGHIFTLPENLYEAGTIEEQYDALKANDEIYKTLVSIEARCNRELEKALKQLPIYQIMSDVEGVGPAVASRIIASVVDIRRFPTDSKFIAFCGAHVFNLNGKKLAKGEIPPSVGGIFVRRRRGQISNWHPEIRQSAFLIADQFNRRPNSFWGQKLIEVKAKLREKHPEVEIAEGGKKKYTDGHIHKMALWKTSHKFLKWLYNEWSDLEAHLAEEDKAANAA